MSLLKDNLTDIMGAESVPEAVDRIVLDLARKGGGTFTLQDMYIYVPWLKTRFPGYVDTEAAIRRALQKLRDRSYIEFVDNRGTYAVRNGVFPRMYRMTWQEPAAKGEAVNHPAHYGGDTQYEVIKVLRAWGLFDDALLFNVVKYVARAGKKGGLIEDLKKARWYLDRRIEEAEAEVAARIENAEKTARG